jgi:hypothetical protein
MTTSAAGEPAPSAGAGKAGGVRNLGRWLTRRWFQARGGGTYQRRRADALVAAAGLGVLVVCGGLVANRLAAGTDVSVFRRINHWPGWLYPPMWTVQLSGVIGALPLVAAAAAVLRRLRLAAALAAATVLKVARAEPRIRRARRQPQHCSRQRFTVSSRGTARRDLVNAAFLSLSPDRHFP